MQDEQSGEQPLLVGHRGANEIDIQLKNSGEFRTYIGLLPDVTVLPAEDEVVGDPPAPGIRADRMHGEKQAGDDADALKQIQPVLENPEPDLHCPALYLTRRIRANRLDVVGNLRLGVHQEVSGNADDSFIRATTRSGGKRTDGACGHVDADHGKVAVGEFPDVGALFEGDSLGATGVRVGADAAEKAQVRFRLRNLRWRILGCDHP
jgi:hypothetical protein